MKRYELSNHLGNVLAVITDRRIQSCTNENVMFYQAQVVSITDYDPFGMEIKDRVWRMAWYRHGLGGQEKNDELKGDGNSIDYLLRSYDSRKGRFLSLDPLAAKFAWNSPYVYAENKVIENRELEGAESINSTMYARAGVMVIELVNAAGVEQINRFSSTGGVVIPTGVVMGWDGTLENRLITGGGGNDGIWEPNPNGQSFRNLHRGGSNGGVPYYSEYRPILWESFGEGPRPDPSVPTLRNVQTANPRMRIGNMAIGARVARNVALISPFVDANLRTALGSRGIVTAINIIRPPTNVATMPHPELPGQTIAINQTKNTAGTSTVTGVGNYVLNINGNTADAAQINQVANQMRANYAPIGLTVNVNLSAAYNGGAGGTYDFNLNYTETSVNTTTTTTTTTALDSSTGLNVPPVN
jgi:hypothetical protein